MGDQIYENLANAMDRLPNGFPRTPSNVEIPLLKKMFTPDEAFLVSHLTGKMEDASTIAERAGVDSKKAELQLLGLGKLIRAGSGEQRQVRVELRFVFLEPPIIDEPVPHMSVQQLGPAAVQGLGPC